jgi:hypothetical protein
MFYQHKILCCRFNFVRHKTPTVAHNQAVTGSIAILSRNEAEDLAAL